MRTHRREICGRLFFLVSFFQAIFRIILYRYPARNCYVVTSIDFQKLARLNPNCQIVLHHFAIRVNNGTGFF